MSQTLKKVNHFLLLLLSNNTSRNQAIALLETASPPQVLALSEIVYNIICGELPLDTKTKSFVKRHKKVLERLAKKTLSEKTKYRLIRQHPKLVLETLLFIKPLLLKLL